MSLNFANDVQVDSARKSAPYALGNFIDSFKMSNEEADFRRERIKEPFADLQKKPSKQKSMTHSEGSVFNALPSEAQGMPSKPISKQLHYKIEQLYGGNPSNFCLSLPDEQLSSISHERISAHQLSYSRSNPSDSRLGNFKFICLRLRKLEFFCQSTQFTQYSTYFHNLFNYMLSENEAIRHKEQSNVTCSQILVHLPEETKANVLLFMLNCIASEEESFRIHELSLSMVVEVIEIAHHLKMRKVVSEILKTVIIQQVNRENVLFFARIAYTKVKFISTLYTSEEVSVDEASEYLNSQLDESERSQRSSESQRKSVATKIVNACIDKDDLIDEVIQEENEWLDFFFYCVDMIALNLFYISQTQSKDLYTMPNQILSEVIGKTVQFFRSDPMYDLKPLIRLIMKTRGCQSVFELLQSERDKVIQEEMAFRQQNHRDTILTWSVKNITQCFYKQSDTIMLLDAQWRFALSYFQNQKTGLRVEIKLLNNPYDINKAKNYFKKQDFELPSNLAAERIDPIAKFEVENEDEPSDKRRKIEELNAQSQNFPSFRFISFLASVHFDFDHQQSEPELYTMICSAKAPTELRRFQDFNLGMMKGYEALNVGIFFQMQELHAMILTYINQNFGSLINDPDIRLLRKDELKILLKHKHLNVTQEDDVVKAICLWVEGQTIARREQKKKQKHDRFFTYKEHLQQQQQLKGGLKIADSINDLLNQVNWDYVSLPCILDVIRTQPLIRTSNVFRNMAYKQFTLRMARKDAQKAEQSDDENSSDSEQDDKKAPSAQPRFCYKYNRSQKNLYPTAADLKHQFGGATSAMPKDVRQFQLLYPVQIYPDFMQHLVDCLIHQVPIIETQQQSFQSNQAGEAPIGKHVQQRLLQAKLLKAQQEVKFIQDQLDSLDLQDLIKPAIYRQPDSGELGPSQNVNLQQLSKFEDQSNHIQEGKDRVDSVFDLLSKSPSQQANSVNVILDRQLHQPVSEKKHLDALSPASAPERNQYRKLSIRLSPSSSESSVSVSEDLKDKSLANAGNQPSQASSAIVSGSKRKESRSANSDRIKESNHSNKANSLDNMQLQVADNLSYNTGQFGNGYRSSKQLQAFSEYQDDSQHVECANDQFFINCGGSKESQTSFNNFLFGKKQDQECQVENQTEEIKSTPSSSSYRVHLAESKMKNSLVSFGCNSVKATVGIQTDDASQPDQGSKQDVVNNYTQTSPIVSKQSRELLQMSSFGSKQSIEDRELSWRSLHHGKQMNERKPSCLKYSSGDGLEKFNDSKDISRSSHFQKDMTATENDLNSIQVSDCKPIIISSSPMKNSEKKNATSAMYFEVVDQPSINKSETIEIKCQNDDCLAKSLNSSLLSDSQPKTVSIVESPGMEVEQSRKSIKNEAFQSLNEKSKNIDDSKVLNDESKTLLQIATFKLVDPKDISTQTDQSLVFVNNTVDKEVMGLEIVHHKPMMCDTDVQVPTLRATTCTIGEKLDNRKRSEGSIERKIAGKFIQKKLAPASLTVSPSKFLKVKADVEDYAERNYSTKYQQVAFQPRGSEDSSRRSASNSSSRQFYSSKRFMPSKSGGSLRSNSRSSGKRMVQPELEQACLLSDSSKMLQQFRQQRYQQAPQTHSTKSAKIDQKKQKLKQYTMQAINQVQPMAASTRQFVKESDRKYRTKEVTISITNNLLALPSNQSFHQRNPTDFMQDFNFVGSPDLQDLGSATFGQTLNIQTGNNYFQQRQFANTANTVKNTKLRDQLNDYVDKRISSAQNKTQPNNNR